MGGSRHIGFCALTVHRSPWTSYPHRASPRSRKGRFLNVIFDSSNFATLIMYKKIPQRSVHVGCIIPVCHWCNLYYREHNSGISVYIIRNGVGWLSCLSLYIGNAKAKTSGISKEVSPTSFLCPYVDRIHNRSINH